ncbi:hypothetical protein ACYSNX_05955 [Myroides sp. LJL115]
MRKLFVFLLLIIYGSSNAQQYDKVFIEKSKVDKNNVVYRVGSNFYYMVKIQSENKEYYLDKAQKDSLTTNKNEAIDEIQLSVVKSKLFGRTNKNQTEIKYSDYPNPTFRTSTGLVDNQENIWLHPPRFGYLKALETCPFPYIKLQERTGFTWTDQMSIAPYWGDPRWGVWEGRLLLNYTYEIQGQDTLTTPLGELKTTKVYGIATTDIGQSSLVAYFNETYGFVNLEYTLFNGDIIILELQRTTFE